MHGNEESYHAMQIKVLMLIQREQYKQLNIVIHNHHDMKWYQELWEKWIEKQKTIEVSSSYRRCMQVHD